MKVAVLKPQKKGNKLVFNIEKPLEEKSIFQLDDIVEKLTSLNYQRYVIRKSRDSNKAVLSKRFR